MMPKVDPERTPASGAADPPVAGMRPRRRRARALPRPTRSSSSSPPPLCLLGGLLLLATIVVLVPTTADAYTTTTTIGTVLWVLLPGVPLLPTSVFLVQAAPVLYGLSDPDRQPKFQVAVPNPLAPDHVYDSSVTTDFTVSMGPGWADTGLVGVDGITPVGTPIWGYGRPSQGYTWPGRTFVVQSHVPVQVRWLNRLPIDAGYLLTGVGNYAGRSVVDTSIHFCFNMPGYTDYTIETDGTPTVPHLHGGHTDDAFDGNSEAFFSPRFAITGPQWPGEVYHFDNSQPATALWYHDHALGLTRLNVYTGLSGFYIIRDDLDTGRADNPLRLPAYPYELPLMIQDRFFKDNGELFYPGFPGDPYYADFITDQEANVDPDQPSVLAEFFGDHMVVNGKIWPRTDVEPRKYRLRLLNACDSRFLVVQFLVLQDGYEPWPIDFDVIGGDQGLADYAKTMNQVVMGPATRLDVIVDFAPYEGLQILLANTGGDEPFGGDIPGPQLFADTDKIMRFDVSQPFDDFVPDDYGFATTTNPVHHSVARTRRLGLFEGMDQYGRLQPLLGTVDPAYDRNYNPIFTPDQPMFTDAGVDHQQLVGTMTWHTPTTENMHLNDVEEWEIWNLSADAHPIHLHMVRFQFVSRHAIVHDSAADEDGILAVGAPPAGDGTYIQEQILVQHDGTVGTGFRVFHARHAGVPLGELNEYAYHYPMDVVVALPGEVTIIRAKFDKPGEYNWHCHILSHEDHEMMRRYHVGQLPEPPTPQAPPPPVSFPAVQSAEVGGHSTSSCHGNYCSVTSTGGYSVTSSSGSYWITVRHSWRRFWNY